MSFLQNLVKELKGLIKAANDPIISGLKKTGELLGNKTTSLESQIADLRHVIDVLSKGGISTGKVQAQSISFMISNRTKCNAGCEGCISRTTPDCPLDTDKIQELDFNRLDIGLDFAARCGATSAIMTGKADPLQERPVYLTKLIRHARAKMPEVDIHTNSFLLGKRHQLKDLVEAGLTMITFSIASFNPDQNVAFMGENARKMDYHRLISEAKDLGLKVRCSLLLTKVSVQTIDEIIDYIRTAKEYGAHQVVIRELWVSDVEVENQTDVWHWNIKNKVPLNAFIEDFWTCHHDNHRHGIKYIWPLPWGTPIFDVSGMNVTFSRCEESLNGATLKSIVHKIDGHGYRDWDHEGSILY